MAEAALAARVAALEERMGSYSFGQTWAGIMLALFDLHGALIDAGSQTKAEAIQRLERHIAEGVAQGLAPATLSVLRDLQVALASREFSADWLARTPPGGAAE